MANKTATQKKAKQSNIASGLDSIKDTTRNINDFALETSTEVLNATINTAGLWQDVAEKAIKGGFKLARKQQDITFDALETVKGQFIASRKRFSKLLSNN